MGLGRTVTLMPWYQFLNSLLFWQAVWFLYFQSALSGAEAIVLYSIYDISTTILEVPSGYFSDRIGRRYTLMLSAICMLLGCLTIAMGNSFALFAIGQILFGAGAAFKSGTDSALLYETLAATGHADEIEAQELRAWRFTLAGFSLSAFVGGAMSLWSPTLPFYASAISFACALWVVFYMVEPKTFKSLNPFVDQVLTLRTALLSPVLTWFFILSVLMYCFSHLPFVFGQPFIHTALKNWGLESETPVISGAISSAMMFISAAASLLALKLRRLLGLPRLLMLAFALQIGLIGALAASTSIWVISVLMLRMVPNSLAYPFILARIQPLLEDSTRATYLSLKSLGARIFFAATLLIAATSAQEAGLLPATDLKRILSWYTGGGLLCLTMLSVWARWVQISPEHTSG